MGHFSVTCFHIYSVNQPFWEFSCARNIDFVCTAGVRERNKIKSKQFEIATYGRNKPIRFTCISRIVSSLQKTKFSIPYVRLNSFKAEPSWIVGITLSTWMKNIYVYFVLYVKISLFKQDENK